MCSRAASASAGNRIRITARLVDGANGGQVWAERYDRDARPTSSRCRTRSLRPDRYRTQGQAAAGREGQALARHADGQYRGIPATICAGWQLLPPSRQGRPTRWQDGCSSEPARSGPELFARALAAIAECDCLPLSAFRRRKRLLDGYPGHYRARALAAGGGLAERTRIARASRCCATGRVDRGRARVPDDAIAARARPMRWRTVLLRPRLKFVVGQKDEAAQLFRASRRDPAPTIFRRSPPAGELCTAASTRAGRQPWRPPRRRCGGAQRELERHPDNTRAAYPRRQRAGRCSARRERAREWLSSAPWQSSPTTTTRFTMLPAPTRNSALLDECHRVAGARLAQRA